MRVNVTSSKRIFYNAHNKADAWPVEAMIRPRTV